MRTVDPRPLLVFLCLLSAAGCTTLSVPNVEDFSFTIMPGSSTTPAGSAAPSYSFKIVPSGHFGGKVTVTAAPPPGFACAPASCSLVLPSYNSAAGMQLTPNSAVTPGVYTIPFTATSGVFSHQASAELTVTVPAASPDFSFTVSPQTTSVVAGSGVAYSFTLTPLNGFSGSAAVSSRLPSGFSCSPANCTAALVAGGNRNVIQVTSSSSVMAGPFELTFTATSGTISHSVQATLNVTSAASSPPVTPPMLTPTCAVSLKPDSPTATRTAFTYTGDPAPPSLVYDAQRNRILVANQQLNEVDVISPETMTVLQRLAIPEPMGVDLSADGMTLIVGTRTHYFYRVAADTLCVTDRQYMPLQGAFNLSPMYPTSLADGSILFGAYDTASTAQGVYLWTPGAGFTQPAGLGELSYSVSIILPSGDRMHAFIAGDDSGGDFGRFDVGNPVAYSKEVAFGSQPRVLAVNSDGSQVLLREDCCNVVLADKNFQTIASYEAGFTVGVLAEPDFSRFYFAPSVGQSITVTDGSFKALGAISDTFSSAPFIGNALAAFDGKHRILELAGSGVGFIDTSQLGGVPAPGSSNPGFFSSGALTPNTPAMGLSTVLNGGSLPADVTPPITFAELNTERPATGVTTTSAQTISLTAPSFASDCADVIGDFGPGLVAFSPQAFCYTPKVFLVDGDSGPTSGGSTVTLYGLGFGATTPTVSIGGRAAPSVTQTAPYSSTNFVLTALTVTVPPGTAGDADITVATSFSSETLPGAFHYVARRDISLPSGVQPFQLVFDSARGRVLLTDNANSRLLVYGLASGALLNTVTTGSGPAGLSLSTDGTKLLLASADYKVSVLDADSYQTLQQVTLPSTSPNVFGPQPLGPPVYVAAMAGDKAYISTQGGYLQGNGPYSYSAIFDYDLTTNIAVPDPVQLEGNDGGTIAIAASADGSTALLDGYVSHAVGGAVAPNDISEDGGSNSDAAVASDGHVLGLEAGLLNSADLLQTVTAADILQYLPGEMIEGFLSGAQFNGSASLYYRGTATHVRMYDANHGNLVRTLEVPGGLSGSAPGQTTSATRLLAVNPDGQEVIAATAAGISVFDFASDPLSIGTADHVAGTLTVNGSGFTSGTTVTVDQTDVAVTFVSAKELQAVLPALPSGAHTVTVNNPSGAAYVLELAFTTP